MWKYLLPCLMVLFSCKEAPPPAGFLVDDEDVLVRITHSSGSMYGELPYLPLLGNVAVVEEDNPNEVLIIGQKMVEGEKVYIRPVGVMRYTEDSSDKTLIVAIPTDPQLRTIDVEDLVDFSVKYGSIKRIIEQWYASYRGLGKNRITGWENKSAALDVLLPDTPE